MAEGGDHSRMQGSFCARCIQNRTYQSGTRASPDTSEGLHSQTTPDTVVLPDLNNGIYRINNLIPSKTRTLASAPQLINNATPLNDLTLIRQTLDVISSGSTFSTQPSSTPSSNLVSPNNPHYLMSSTGPNTPQLSLNIPSGTVPESSIASSNQSTLQINNKTNEHMARAEGNNESETEIDTNLPEEVSMPEEEIIHRRKQLCPHNDKGECDDDCPYLHGRICHMCHTHRINPNNPGLHFNACLEQHKKQSQDMECNICLEKVVELEKDPYFCIQENCNHCFCKRCFIAWRTSKTMANHRACPVCRIPTGFAIISRYWVTCPLSKRKVMEWMKNNEGNRTSRFRKEKFY